jgi:Putative MetA-pathway of phenol degradation
VLSKDSKGKSVMEVREKGSARRWVLIITVLLATICALAQEQTPQAPSTPPSPVKAEEKPKGIQDNSFLVEEAYNQEFGVVQHINGFERFAGNNWVYTFTQEWPAPGIKHQLSYTIAAQNSGNGSGFGDALVNYRYQLVGNGDARLAMAPRLSLIVPSGDWRRSLGSGSAGLQFLIPASIVLSDKWVTHLNAGGTFLPNAHNSAGDKAFTKAYNFGHSIIWLPTPRVNFMLESIFVGNEDVVAPDRVRRTHDILISPGIRWAYNFKNGLQIVPGIAAPQGVGSSAGQHGLFLYLSFEHPFRHIEKN